MNAPNQPPGGNGRGRQPPAQPPAAQQPLRPAAQRPAAPARPPQPAVPNAAALRPQPPQQQRQQPASAPQQPAARPPAYQPRPTPSNALPGPGRRPPQPPPAPPAAPRPSGQNGHAGPPIAPPMAARPQAQAAAPQAARQAAPQAGTRPTAQARPPAQARPAPAQQQPTGPRPSRVTVNGAAPANPAPPVRPGVQTQQQQPQRPPQPARPAQAAPQRPAAQPPVQPPLPPDTGRPALGADDPYPPLVATPLDGAPVVDPRPISARSPRAAAQPENVPMPSLSRPSRRSRNPFVIVGNLFLTLFFLIAICAGVGFVIGKQRFEAPGPLTEDRIVNVPRGGIRDTADLLMREGVIDQPYVFIAGALMFKAQHDLKYGEYRFVKGASLRDVVDTIIEGKVVQHGFTVAEGLTSDQIVQRLTENDVLTGNIRDVPREGTLLPETYRFTRGMTREQIIRRMQQDHRRVLQEVWERRSPDLPIRTPEQLVILASIIEKETGKPEERTRVASVFVNRLRQRMKLQSDPTIIYGLVGGKGALGRPIMRSEIEQPTPYNTYVIDGLPPGPIANPGRASLEAAANPARTKELFFVADGTGGHAFSDTYEQHQRHVARLRAMEQGRGAAQPAAPRTR